MKKLLSVVLALAMIASCFIVGTVVSAEEATPNAIKISNNAVAGAGKADFLMKAPFLTAADFGEEDTLDVTFLINNPFDKEISFSVFATEWDSYRDTVYTTNETDPETGKPTGEKTARTDSILIPANTVGEVTVTYAKTGYFYHSNASILFATGNYLDKMAFRIQCGNEELAAGATIEVAIKDQAMNAKFLAAAQDIEWMAGHSHTVTKVNSTAIADALPKPNAVKVSNNAVTSAGTSDFLIKAPFLTAADFGENDTIDVTYLISNPFDKEIDFRVFATEWDSYRDTVYTTNETDSETGKPSGTKVADASETIPANSVGEITVTYSKTGYFYHNNASILFATGNYLDKLSVRIGCGKEVLAAGATIEVAIKDEALNAKFLAAAQSLEWKNGHSHTVTKITSTAIAEALAATPTPSATATATATPTPAPTPNAIEIKGLADAAYYINSGTGVFNADDIKDGILTKELTVKNIGENDITVQICIQATVTKADGGATWAGFSSGDYVEIATGESETFVIDVEFEDGVTEILGQEVTVDKLFYRLNFNNNQQFYEGDGVLIYGDQDLVTGYAAKSSTASISYATKIIDIPSNSKPTGDALPVALVAVLLAATAAFVVVAKKRKED